MKKNRYLVGENKIMSVNEKIRLIREAKGLTQEDVAEKLGISPSVYGDIERGDNDPKLSRLQKIAEILEMELPKLIDLTETGAVNININKKGKQREIYIGSQSSMLKDKEIAMQKREIEQLNKIIALLESKQTK